MASRIPTLLIAVGLTLEGLPAPVAGQTIRGQVRDSITGIPVDRGFMVLLDSTGAEVARVLTTAEGHFSLRVPAPGTYRLRSERIGFRLWESPPVTVEQARPYEVEPRINALPRRLETIAVTGRRSECEEHTGPDLGLLWEEARKALRAASWSAEQSLYLHRVHRFERELDGSRRNVKDEKITLLALSSEMPFKSLAPDSLIAHGYVETGGDEAIFHGPDAYVLLDESFHRTHCFWAVRGEREHRGQIGLAFEPAPDRTLPDVEGTLWLDQETGELRTVEFRYANLPRWISSEHVGGWATFLPMPSGAWILDRWQIQMPIVERRPRRRPRINGYLDMGAAVLETYTPEGEPVYVSPELVTVRGTVFDSGAGRPLADEPVYIVNTEYIARTDSAGRFEFRALLEGAYTFTTRRMDWLGYRRGRIHTDIAPGDTTVTVSLAIPTLERVHGELCPRAPPATNRIVHGEVRTPEGLPLEDVEITARWEPGVERKSKTDPDGRYLLCDAPVGVAITIDVRAARFHHDPVELTFMGSDVLITTATDRNSFHMPDRIVRLTLVVLPEDPSPDNR